MSTDARQLTIRRCGCSFCTTLAPFWPGRLLCRGQVERDIIGRCAYCGTYRCARTCTARLPLSDAAGESWELACLACGTVLGSTAEDLWLDDGEFGAANEAELGREKERDDAAWAGLMADAISGGWIEPAAVAASQARMKEGDSSAAEELLWDELARADSAGWAAGAGRALMELGRIADAREETDRARELMDRAEPYLRQCGDETQLRTALAMKALALREQRPADALVALDEAIPLFRKAVQRGDQQFEKALEQLSQMRISMLLATGKNRQAILEIAAGENGASIVTQLAEMTLEKHGKEGRLHPHDPDPGINEGAVRRLAEQQDVWGCPAGHFSIAAFISVPRGQQGFRVPCIYCGQSFVLFNRYFHFTAGVPDRARGLLRPEELARVPPESVALLSFALCCRDGGQTEDAIALEREVFDRWREELPPRRRASALSFYARALQDRDEHTAALMVLEPVLDLARRPGTTSEFLPTTLNNRGISLAALGRISEAEGALRQAARLNPALPNPYYWLARIYHRRAARGDERREKRSWNAYLTRGATSEARVEEARQRLAALTSAGDGPDA